MNFRQPPAKAPGPVKAKRYGWYRTYNDYPSHPKWRIVSRKSGAHVSVVVHTVDCLFACASKNRRGGWIGNFSLDECAEIVDVPVETVANIYRVLEELEWLGEDYILDWADRNPDQEDPTAAERQRRKRARVLVRKKLARGQPITDEEAGLLSRVTANTPPQVNRPQPLGVFMRVEAEDESNPEAVNAALIATAANARMYLLGNGTASDWGSASGVVADKMGMRRFAADTTIRRWLGEIDGDVVALATIIDDANHDALQLDRFESIVRQAIARIAREKHSGATLPFPPAAIAGGRK